MGIPGKKICLCPVVKTNQTDFHTPGRDPRLSLKPRPGVWSPCRLGVRPGVHVRRKSGLESGVYVCWKSKSGPESTPTPKPCSGAGIHARPKALLRAGIRALPKSRAPEPGSAPVSKAPSRKPESMSAGSPFWKPESAPKVPVRVRNILLLDQIHPPSSRRIWPVR